MQPHVKGPLCFRFALARTRLVDGRAGQSFALEFTKLAIDHFLIELFDLRYYTVPNGDFWCFSGRRGWDSRWEQFRTGR